MPIPPLQKQLVEHALTRFCEQWIPKHLRNEVNLSFEIRGASVTLFENRPVFSDQTKWSKKKVVQFRFDETTNLWTLYGVNRNGRWLCYPETESTSKFTDLVREVDQDPIRIFWG